MDSRRVELSIAVRVRPCGVTFQPELDVNRVEK
jgi:hypothetical protein